jgi:hypothetical protein
MASSLKLSSGKFTGPDKIANFRTFKTAVDSLAEARQKHFDPLGLLGFVISEAEWNLIPGNAIAADPTAAPPIIAGIRPRPTLPTYPELPNAGATASAFTRFKHLVDIFNGVTNDLFELKQAIMDALDEGDMASIMHPVRGVRDVDHAGIMRILHGTYGRIQEADIHRWRSSLADNAEPGMTLIQKLTQHKRTVLLLENSATVNNFDQIHLFKTAMATHADVTACIARYDHANPDTFARTFAGMEAFLILHAPPLTSMSSLGYSNATTTRVPLDQEETAAALATTTRQTDRDRSKPDTRNATGRGRGGRAGRYTGGRGTIAHTPTYCYAHGYVQHSGKDCDYMASRMISDGGTYSPKNVATASHLDDPTGSRRNAPA